MTNTHTIGVIGTGRLGLSFALLCANRGYTVTGSDTNSSYIDSLNNKTFKTIEPAIEQLLEHTSSFTATTDNLQVVDSTDLIFLFVPTPSLSSGEYDHSYIDQVAQQLLTSEIDLSSKTLVIGCTVMPGYTQHLQECLKPTGIQVAYNPEFIAQGDIVGGLRSADMILIGTQSEEVVHMLTAVYRTIMDHEPVINAMSPTAAEITKIGINCFLATKISYANMIGEVAIQSGVEQEVPTILRAIGSDSRIGTKYLHFGHGYGGVCIPRDGRALGAHCARVGATSILPRTMDQFNQFHLFFLKDYLIAKNPDKDIPFLFNQLSYKKGVSILTDSQQYLLCKQLLESGYRVDITEIPQVIEQVTGELEKYGDRVTYGTAKTGYTVDI